MARQISHSNACSVHAGSADTTITAKGEPAADTAARCISLATRVCDQVAELSIALNGYLALERFVVPVYADENQASVPASRNEMAGMLRALNAQLQRQVDALEFGTTVLKTQMSAGGEAQAG